MTPYLDTSSMVKLYVQEEGTKAVQELASQSTSITTSWLAYPEARAAFAGKYRRGELTEEQYRRVIAAFEGDWGSYLALEVSYHILLEAGQLAEKHGLKAADAIHLASGRYIASIDRRPASFLFVCHDGQLLRAAQAEGLVTQLG